MRPAINMTGKRVGRWATMTEQNLNRRPRSEWTFRKAEAA